MKTEKQLFEYRKMKRQESGSILTDDPVTIFLLTRDYPIEVNS